MSPSLWLLTKWLGFVRAAYADHFANGEYGVNSAGPTLFVLLPKSWRFVITANAVTDPYIIAHPETAGEMAPGLCAT